MKEEIEIRYCEYPHCEKPLIKPSSRQKFCNKNCRDKNTVLTQRKKRAGGGGLRAAQIPEEFLVRGDISTLKGGLSWK